MQPFDKNKNSRWRYFQKALRYYILNTMPFKIRGTYQEEPLGLPKMSCNKRDKNKVQRTTSDWLGGEAFTEKVSFKLSLEGQEESQ